MAHREFKDRVYAQFARIGAALSSDKRLELIDLLAQAPRNVEALAAETARALHDHELIKVKAGGGDREARDTLFAELAQRTGSALVHRIGNVAVLYRPRADLPRILIPDA